MRLFHGSSYNTEPFEILEEGVDAFSIFGGIFAHESPRVADAHGNIFYMDIPDEKILSSFELKYSSNYIDICRIANETLRRDLSETEQDLFWELVIEENLDWDDTEDAEKLFGISDPARISWECQRLRGVLAKNLGYQAVECPDEHGTSYLVLPGAKLHKYAEEIRY